MPRFNASKVAATQKAAQHARKTHAMHEVHAASLRALARELRQAHQDKQEAPGVDAPEASTDSNTITGGVKWSLNRV